MTTSDQEFTQKTQAFINFLIENGVKISPKVTIADLRKQHQGRGVVAVEDIANDEVLFTLPKEAVLNYETSELFKKFDNNEEKINQVLETYNQWEILILCLFYELEILGNGSKWAAYFDVLPKEFQTLMYWNDGELNSLLKPSLVVDRVGKQDSLDMYQNLHDNGLKDLNLEEHKETFTVEKFHCIATLIQSYSFDVEKDLYVQKGDNKDKKENDDEDEEEEEYEVEPIKTMVCLADTLNADTNLVNANLTYENDELAMKSVKPIAKGEQVYNTYGEHPNAEILRRYGYVEWGSSKHDFGEVPLSLVKQMFVEKYNVKQETVDEVIRIISKDKELDDNYIGEEAGERNKENGDEEEEEEEEDDDDDNGLISDSYECYVDGLVNPEFYYLIQILTSILKIENDDSFLHKYSQITSLEEKKKYIKRFTKKILQLINSNRITEEAIDNYQNLLDKRLAQYPENLVKNAVMAVPEKDEFTRKDFAECVLKSEINAIKNCKEYFTTKKFSNIEDGKLIRNLLKKYEGKKEDTKDRKKRRKLIK